MTTAKQLSRNEVLQLFALFVQLERPISFRQFLTILAGHCDSPNVTEYSRL